MSIQEVPWFTACVETFCPMCELLADKPRVALQRTARLNSHRDGWMVVEFVCNECGFTPPAITACLDPKAPKANGSLIVEPTDEEVEEVTAKPAPRKSRIVEPARPVVEVDELFAHAEKRFPPSMKLKTGEVLTRSVTKWENPDASGIKVVYTDGHGSTLRDKERTFPNPFHVERTLFCEPDLPDNQEMVDWVMAKVAANNKWDNPSPRRVTQRPALNSGRSKLRVTCGECGDTSGNCGCPGILKNIGVPSNLRANTNILMDPDGNPVETLQHKLAPETIGM